MEGYKKCDKLQLVAILLWHLRKKRPTDCRVRLEIETRMGNFHQNNKQIIAT